MQCKQLYVRVKADIPQVDQ